MLPRAHIWKISYSIEGVWDHKSGPANNIKITHSNKAIEYKIVYLFAEVFLRVT